MSIIYQNIAFISEHASPLASLGGIDTGGQNVYVAQVSKYLSLGHYKVDVFTRCENEEQPLIVNWEKNVRVIHITAGPKKIIPKEDILPYMEEFKQNMLNFIKAEKLYYTLIHANFFMSGLVAAGIKRELNIPFVITFHALGEVRKIHQGDNDRFPAERFSIEKNVVNEADAIIAECPQDKDDLIRYYGASPNRISIIPCGYSEKEFYPVGKKAARFKLNIDEREHVLLQLGRMVPRKGVDNVIRALGELKAMGKRARLLIVGGEINESEQVKCPEMQRLISLAIQKGVRDMVHFTGRKTREQLKYYYSAADIFITTPWYEPFGITPLEAMACGTPVIGSNVGGIKYSVVDGITGALIPPDDPFALAEKIIDLISDKIVLKNMGISALNRVKRYFTWFSVAEKISELYATVIKADILRSKKPLATDACRAA